VDAGGKIGGMQRSAPTLLDEAKKLSVAERAMVAEKLLETLDPGAEVEIEAAWAAEAVARAEEVEADPSVLISWARRSAADPG